MTKRYLPSALLLLILPTRCALAVDEITITGPKALVQLVSELSQRYGYLVTYEDAPVDTEREVTTMVYAPGRMDKFEISRPVTFHVPRGPATSDVSSGVAGPEAILPLSKELIQPMVDEYNASGNPSRFAVSFDGTYAHIYAVSHKVNGRMEDFQPILSTKVTMPPQTAPCYQTLNYLYAELRRMRNVNVAQSLIGANWLFRDQCTIVGADLTAGDVVAQVAHEFGTDHSQVAPGKELRIPWWLTYDAFTDTYYLSMHWVPNKSPQADVAPTSSPATSTDTPAPARPACTPPSKIRPDGKVVFDAGACNTP